MAKKKIEQYEHSKEERANIPHVGLVTPASDPETGEKKKYAYDPHLDPQLVWTGKAEHTSFEVPTVSLHVHERIDPKTIIESIKKDKDDGGQMSLFDEKKPLREAIDFYKHKEGWSNRLIAGDSLLVMNSLLEKEGMAGKVQMVYFDPPYGIKFGSNFQPYTNNRNVKDGSDQDLSTEPEMIKAFRDTWELGIHSFLTYFRDRIKLAKELLNDSGSLFIQISDEHLDKLKLILNEEFGEANLISLITIKKTAYQASNTLGSVSDYILWFAKDRNNLKVNQLFVPKESIDSIGLYKFIQLPDGTRRNLTKEEFVGSTPLPNGARRYRLVSIVSQGFSETGSKPFLFEGEEFQCPNNCHWKTTHDGLNNLVKSNLIVKSGRSLARISFIDDFPVSPINNIWTDTMTGSFTDPKIYVVQTNTKIVERCMLMASNPGDIVLDPTCGSGTTAFVADRIGRRWITCDTSRVAIHLAKQRLMSSVFTYYKLAYPLEGVSSGFQYETVNRITLKSVANNQPPEKIHLFDKPIPESAKIRVTGPFTVEAVPAPHVSSFDELEKQDTGSDTSIARSGETNRQSEWRDELLRAGVRAKGGNIIQFTRVEPLTGTRFIQAEAETKEDTPKKVLVVFGPEHAPLEQRTVENAWQEARALKPDMLLFCAFQFDEEAAKDIDELIPSIAGMQLIKAQMNADLLTDDLRKKRSSNESFWLVGQPDIRVHKESDGKVKVEVMGFDYYNPKTGDVESGGKKNIAMWMMDADYDDRSLFPSQVFFPMAGSGEGWDKLAKNLKAEIDEEKIEAFNGTVSLPFEPGNKIAVKIIDDRGIESLRVITM